jgi:hypothetical protein
MRVTILSYRGKIREEELCNVSSVGHEAPWADGRTEEPEKNQSIATQDYFNDLPGGGREMPSRMILLRTYLDHLSLPCMSGQSEVALLVGHSHIGIAIDRNGSASYCGKVLISPRPREPSPTYPQPAELSRWG